MSPLPYRIVHHGKHDPRARVGGVESFAVGLGKIFEEVSYTTPGSADFERELAAGALFVCDNQHVLDFPRGYPVIAFRHGVAARKAVITRNWSDARLAWRQALAARRRESVWCACAQWIAKDSARYYGGRTDEIIYHPIDLERFDGQRDEVDPKLVLHDARSAHKGQALIGTLARALPGYRFEALDCAPSEVPNRMRRAAAFLHLSRYEGNSIVCNEAMAMDLPCLFTDVGLMNDQHTDLDVEGIDGRLARRDDGYLVSTTRHFLESLATRARRPRRWIEAHATYDVARAAWLRAVQRLESGRRGPGIG